MCLHLFSSKLPFYIIFIEYSCHGNPFYYCGIVLLPGLSHTQINRLQKLEKTAACIVWCAQKYDSISILDSLHWLPVRERISFKILLLVFKAQSWPGTRYFSDMLKPYEPTHSRHSQQPHLLQVPKTRLVTGGDRSYVQGEKFCNNVHKRYDTGLFEKYVPTASHNKTQDKNHWTHP